MAMVWSANLCIGNKEIDGQHKELFSRVNKFTDAMKDKKSREEMGPVIKFLEQYVIEHFGMEERYMLSHNFKGYLHHKRQHDEFIKAFTEIKNKYDEKGPSLDLIIAVNYKLGDWLRTHIPVVDKELATFLREQAVA